LAVTTKYRYDPKFNTGGTFGVNYAAMDGDILAFNYRQI
jgi:glyceraldehyde-3-phosphate dehydrogenase (ferredoxin)